MRSGQAGRGAAGLELLCRVGRSACPPSPSKLRWEGGHGAPPLLPPTIPRLMPQLRLHDGLANFGAAVGAFISEVDLRHALMRLDVPHKHFEPHTARADDKARLDIVVMMDVGWHVGSPQIHPRKHSPVVPDPRQSIRLRRTGDHELSRTQRERLHYPSMCDRFASLWNSSHNASILFV